MAKRRDSVDTRIYKVLKPLLEKKGIDVYKIVFFGSYAREDEREDSDIDLVIVSRTFRDKSVFERVELTTGIGRKLVKAFRKPFDLMFYSDLEWDDPNSIVIDAAKQEGRILHG